MLFWVLDPQRVSKISGTFVAYGAIFLEGGQKGYLAIPNKSDGELHEIMIKPRGHFTHTGRGIEPTVKIEDFFSYIVMSDMILS